MPLIYDPQTGQVTEELPERPTRASSSSKPKAKPKRVQEVLPPGGKQEFGVSRFPTIEESVTEEQTKRLKTRRQAGKKFRRPRLEDRDPSIRGIRASTEAERQLDTRYEVNRDFGLEGVANIVDTTAQSLGEFAVGLPENVAALGLAVSDKMRKMRGLEPQTEEYAEALEAIAQPTRAAKDTVRSYFPTDLEMDKSWAYGKIPRAAASSLPYIGLGALGGGPAAVAMLGAVENAGQTYEEAVAKGASHEDALKAALPGGVIGTLEGALGVGRVGFLRRMSQRGVVGGAAHGAIEEGLVQEAITQLANNVNAKLVSGYDPKRAFTDGLAESILTGGAVGLLFGGGAGAAARLSSVPRRETSLPQMDLEISPIADDLPGRVYHGTASKEEIRQFDASKGSSADWVKGIFTTESPEAASIYAEYEGAYPDPKTRTDSPGAVYPFGQPNIQKPFDADEYPTDGELQRIYDAADQVLGPGASDSIRYHAERYYGDVGPNHPIIYPIRQLARDIYNIPEGEAVTAVLQAAGYDGLTHMGANDLDSKSDTRVGPHRVWVAFDGSQLTPAFSPVADDRAQGYYSALTKNIQEKFPAKIKLDDVRKRLTSESSGVKKEEYEFSSLDELLAVKRAEGSDTITKHELLDYLAENHIQVHERTLGGPGIEALKERQVKLYEERNALSSELVEVERGLIKPYADWLMEQTDDTVLAAPQTNYIRQRNAVFDSSPEHNLILERKREIDDEIAVLQQALNLQGPIGAESEVIKGGQPGTMREIVLSVQGTDGPAYTGGHFGHIPNTVAYVRFNEGVDSEGRKILIGQNFQSDVHQQTSLNYDKIKAEHDRWAEEYAHFREQGGDIDSPDGRYLRNEISKILPKLAKAEQQRKLPALPFKTTWPDLLMKRLVKYAADNGFDRIVWTTGQQQIDYWSGSVGEGEGHRIIYDEKLPKAAKALAKKFGSKYGTADPITGPPEVKENTGENAKSHPWRVADREFVSKANAELYASSLDKSVQKIHYLDITPAMREQAQGEGFALFDRASKKGRMPQTDEEDTIRRWGVPRWDPNVNREPASQMVQFARFEFRPHGNRGRIYTNNIGTVILKAVDHMVQQGKAVTNPSDELTQEWFSHGRAIPIWVAEEHIKWLNANAHQSPVLESLRDEMVRAAAAAVRRGQEAIPVISLDRTDVDSIRQTIRHEDIHRWQWGHESMYGYVVDPLWAKLQPWYKSAVAALRGRGYNFPVKFDGTYTVELLAHLGAGQHERLGFTAEQGAQVVASIMKHIASTRGMSALKNLALDAKVKERINDLARISERSGPRATAVVPVTEYSIRPSGGIRERLSRWFGPRGGSETAVSEFSPVADDFENVDTNVDPPGRWERLKTTLRGHGLPFEFTWLDKLKRLGIDEAHPILKAWHFIQTGQEAPSKNAEYLLRLWLGSNGKVDRVFSEGMINGQNQIVTPGGLDWLLGPWQGAPKSQMMDEMEAAIHMMVAERTLELATKKWGQPNSGLSITAPISGVADTVTLQQQAGDQFMADIQASIRKLNQLQQRDPQALARIQDAADRYRKWARALLDYQLEKGRLKQETYDQLVANGDYYVDMHRLFDDDPDSMLDSTPGKYGKVKKLMRKFKGSREEISNPYVNLMIATQQTIKESDRNYAMNAFVEPLRQQQPDPQMQALYHMIGHRTPQATKDSVRVYNQGAEEHWEFHPEIEAALKGYGDIPGNVITDVLSLPFKILRTAITHTPGFLFRNFVRDAQQRTLLSRGNTSIRQILNPLEGSKPWDALTQIIRPLSKADRDSFWLTGASQAGYYANSRIDWQARLRDAVNDVRGDRSVLLAFPEQLWQFIAKDLPAGVENINRFAEFKEQRKQALAQGMSQYDADIKAAFEARDLMDFAVSGTAVKQLNKFVMFLNPALQGIKRTAKGAREAPLPFLFRWSLYALMPALGELWWNFGQGDDTLEEWRNMPAWRKDLFYNLKVGDDKWLAIPKPFELGVAASLTNRLIDYSVLDNKQAFDDAGKSIWKSLIPIDDWSKLVGPFLSVAEVGSNWSYFYDEHIIPPGDEGRDPELARKRGSFVGQQIAKIIDKDPRLIDYFLRANLSDWATIANYTGELFNAELNPKERSEIYKKLVTLSTGNVVRPTKPDQAVDVKRVMNAATRTYGDRADWYTPLTDYINAYRDTPEASEREKVVRDALAYASRVRQFLPQLDKDLKESIQKLEKLEATNPSYKSLDKKARGVVDSRLRSDLRSFDHEIMTARVRGDKIAKAQAIVNKRSYNLSLALAQEILQYREQTQEKALERRVTPPMPRR